MSLENICYYDDVLAYFADDFAYPASLTFATLAAVNRGGGGSYPMVDQICFERGMIFAGTIWCTASKGYSFQFWTTRIGTSRRSLSIPTPQSSVQPFLHLHKLRSCFRTRHCRSLEERTMERPSAIIATSKTMYARSGSRECSQNASLRSPVARSISISATLFNA